MLPRLWLSIRGASSSRILGNVSIFALRIKYKKRRISCLPRAPSQLLTFLAIKFKFPFLVSFNSPGSIDIYWILYKKKSFYLSSLYENSCSEFQYQFVFNKWTVKEKFNINFICHLSNVHLTDIRIRFSTDRNTKILKWKL